MFQKKYIVCITDCTDIAANEIRASLIPFVGNRNDISIEPIVPIEPFSVINANFALRLMAEDYPDNTIFMITFNPVKKRPKSLIGRTEKKNFIFMGRNTGVFDWLTRDFGCKELYDASQQFTIFSPNFVSFSGKYVTAPTIGKIATGTPLRKLGTSISKEEIQRLDLPDGTIVHIDNFGLMKFAGSIPDPKEDDKYEITINDKKFIAVYSKRMMDKDTGEWVLFPGSSFGLPELGMVRENGAKLMGFKVGDVIKLKKI